MGIKRLKLHRVGKIQLIFFMIVPYYLLGFWETGTSGSTPLAASNFFKHFMDEKNREALGCRAQSGVHST